MIYYDVDPLGDKLKLSSESIISALDGVLAGTLSYKHSENVVERGARVSHIHLLVSIKFELTFASQYVNNKLVFMEHIVSFHPWAVSFLVVAVLAALVIFFRRLWSQEAAYASELARKARLD